MEDSDFLCRQSSSSQHRSNVIKGRRLDIDSCIKGLRARKRICHLTNEGKGWEKLLSLEMDKSIAHVMYVAILFGNKAKRNRYMLTKGKGK